MVYYFLMGDMMLFEWLLGFYLLLIDWLIWLVVLCWIFICIMLGVVCSWLLLVGFVLLLGLLLYLLFGYLWLLCECICCQVEVLQVICEEQVLQYCLCWILQLDIVSVEIVLLVQCQGDFMLVYSNVVDLLIDYDELLYMLIVDIDQVEDCVYLLYYLMFDDVVGEVIVEVLQCVVVCGVQCCVLFDVVGVKCGLCVYCKCLQVCDIEVCVMLFGGLCWCCSGCMDLCNYCKIVVIDNEVVYVGLQNLVGLQFVFGYLNCELVVCVCGLVVVYLEVVFVSDWYMEIGQCLDVIVDVFECSDDIVIQLLFSGFVYFYSNVCDVVVVLIYLVWCWLVMVILYFVFDEVMLSVLCIVVLFGVQVQLILLVSNNQWLILWVQEVYYDELLCCGVCIVLYELQFLYVKYMSVDEDIVVFGLINMDICLFVLNVEIGLVCYDCVLVQQLCVIEDGYLCELWQLDLQQWCSCFMWWCSCEGIVWLVDVLM